MYNITLNPDGTVVIFPANSAPSTPTCGVNSQSFEYATGNPEAENLLEFEDGHIGLTTDNEDFLQNLFPGTVLCLVDSEGQKFEVLLVGESEIDDEGTFVSQINYLDSDLEDLESGNIQVTYKTENSARLDSEFWQNSDEIAVAKISPATLHEVIDEKVENASGSGSDVEVVTYSVPTFPFHTGPYEHELPALVIPENSSAEIDLQFSIELASSIVSYVDIFIERRSAGEGAGTPNIRPDFEKTYAIASDDSYSAISSGTRVRLPTGGKTGVYNVQATLKVSATETGNEYSVRINPFGVSTTLQVRQYLVHQINRTDTE